MKPPDHEEPSAAALGRLAQNVDPPAEAYPALVRRLRERGLIGHRPRYAGWLLTAAGMTAAAVLALALLPAPGRDREYLLLLDEPAGYQAAVTPDEQRARVREYAAWAGLLSEENHLVTAGELESGGTIVSSRRTAPLAPAASPTGYFLIRARSPEEAERLARSSPHLKYGGEVVVRPVVQQ